MALKLSDLSVLAYANNFTLWHYKTADAAVTSAGYFNGAAEMMRANDLIVTTTSTGGTPATKFYLVSGISSGVVSVAVYS